jgi:hypothetical protein
MGQIKKKVVGNAKAGKKVKGASPHRFYKYPSAVLQVLA